jgi:hypothetical protein
MKPHIAIVFICLLYLAVAGCQRTIRVTEEMTWKCVPEEYNPAYGAKPDEYVEFRFVRNPHCEELQSSRNFCAEMRKANRPVVKVEFELHGYRQLNGYQMISVDGRPLQDVGGWASSGATDYSGPSPLNEAFRR